MGCKGAALAIAVVAIVAIAGVAIWLNDGDDGVPSETEDVNLHVREDVRVGDFIEAEYTYPDIFGLSVPLRMEVTAVGEDSVTVTSTILDQTVTETLTMEDFLNQDEERTHLGQEARQTLYGYTLCDKYSETSETEEYTSWYVDGVLVAMDGTFDGMRCIVEVTEYSYVTKIVGTDGSLIAGNTADFFYDGTDRTFVETFDVMGYQLSLNVNAFGMGTTGYGTLNLHAGITLDGADALRVTEIRIEGRCSSGMDMVLSYPEDGRVYETYPGMTVHSDSDITADTYSVTLGFGSLDSEQLSIGGLNTAYMVDEDGGTFSGTITVVTEQGSVSCVFAITVDGNAF